MSEALKILVADDHEVVRAGLRLILEGQPNWVVCGEAATGRQAIGRHTPDIRKASRGKGPDSFGV